ncbi:MAG TPA: GNAT family N-acetyltransferase [Dictyobacter sp.]|nr:GNAT family N-acetyltransferase [Dictyobacter sp.]
MSHLAVRPARDIDRETVLAFCQNTWEFGDYIESVWDNWLNDSNGSFLTATIEGTAVGIIHLQMLTETEAWLEGLRVDPSYRRQGIARTLIEAAILEAMKHKATDLRLVTDENNTATIHISTSLHMRKASAFINYYATPLEASADHSPMTPLQQATIDDLDDIIQYLNTSNIFPITGGLYYTKFQAYAITDTLLEHHIKTKHIYLLRRWNRLDGLAIAEPLLERDEKRLSVGYIDGTAIESFSLIAHALRYHLAIEGLEKVRIYAPDSMLVQDALSGIEYERTGSTFHIFERGLE